MGDGIDWQDDEHMRLVALWLQQARACPPSSFAWGVLVAQILRAAADYRTAGDDNKSRLGLIRDVALALSNFMGAEAAFRDDPLARSSMMPLLGAIADIEQGRASPLFEPLTPHNRPPLSVAEANTAGAAARAVSELLASGVKLQTAASKVAQAVRYGRCAGHARCTASTVKGWRNRIHEGQGSISPIAINRYRAKLPPHVRDDPKGRADFLLGALRHGVGFR